MVFFKSMDLRVGLKERYEIAVSSSSEREFYENVYYYFDYIHRKPELLKIFEDSQRVYSKKHGDIWDKPRYESEEELNIRSEKTYKMEHFDMFATACGMYMRIYLKINNYKTAVEPDSHQDPMAVALIKGPEYASEQYFKRYPERGRGVKKDITKNYKSWFEDKRPFYERELRSFHLMFLDEIDRINEIEKLVSSKKLEFDSTSSILTIGETSVEISLKNDKTNSHYVLEYMFENDPFEQCFYTDILETKFFNEGDWRKIYRACNDIKEKVRKQLNTEDFLEIKTGKSGWVRVNPLYR